MDIGGESLTTPLESAMKRNPAVQFALKSRQATPTRIFQNESRMAQGAGLRPRAGFSDPRIKSKQDQELHMNALRFQMLKKGGSHV